jgi:predicted ester cyclase
MNTRVLVANYMDEIWNKKQFEAIGNYLHKDFIDHSLPPSFLTSKEGTIKWIIDTGNSFEHKTIIEDQVTEGNKSIIRIRLLLKHIGIWRDIEPTGVTVSVVGYRYFRVHDDKIIEHWGLIDGQAIENQLKKELHGCKIAE